MIYLKPNYEVVNHKFKQYMQTNKLQIEREDTYKAK